MPQPDDTLEALVAPPEFITPEEQARRKLFNELQEGLHERLCPTADAVEALFAARGLAPGNDSPRPDAFQPRDVIAWTLPMAIAWIAWRSIDAVTEQCELFRTTQFEWRHMPNWAGVMSWQLEPTFRGPSTYFEVELTEAINGQLPLCSVDDAKTQLWAGLVAGKPTLTAIGETGRRHQIAKEEFLDLKLFEDHGEEYLAAGMFSQQYLKPLLLNVDVLRLWPAGSKKRKGRKPAFDWDEIKAEALRLMDHHGDFMQSDPDWSGPEKLIKSLQDFYGMKHKGSCPERSTIQSRCSSWLDEWRKRRAAGN